MVTYMYALITWTIITKQKPCIPRSSAREGPCMSMCDRTERACIISGGWGGCLSLRYLAPSKRSNNNKLTYPASGAKKCRLVFPCRSGEEEKEGKTWVFSLTDDLGRRKKQKKGKKGGGRRTPADAPPPSLPPGRNTRGHMEPAASS